MSQAAGPPPSSRPLAPAAPADTTRLTVSTRAKCPSCASFCTAAGQKVRLVDYEAGEERAVVVVHHAVIKRRLHPLHPRLCVPRTRQDLRNLSSLLLVEQVVGLCEEV